MCSGWRAGTCLRNVSPTDTGSFLPEPNYKGQSVPATAFVDLPCFRKRVGNAPACLAVHYSDQSGLIYIISSPLFRCDITLLSTGTYGSMQVPCELEASNDKVIAAR
jgi:hypothetical protein